MGGVCISATASNQGKTILTAALLYHYKKSVRAYKIGPDFIDPQFHELITKTPSINLDTFIMNDEQVKWLFNNYNNKDIAIIEGVMGFYDGMERKSSTYDVSRLLDIPTVMILDGSGSYITVCAVLKGLVSYRNDNTIKAVVLNKLSSEMHYKLIKQQIEKEFDEITVLGWIKKDLDELKSTHLGLDLDELNKIGAVAKAVLTHIDLKKLEEIASLNRAFDLIDYPFEKISKIDKKLAIVNDKNFSFLYFDNLAFFKEVFQEVVFIDSTKDESIPLDADIVYIPGGYVETESAYKRIKDSSSFRNSLILHAQSKAIYAECAGLLYLGNRVDEKKMSSILDIDFTLKTKRERLGYYFCTNGIKGHAFHYTAPVDPPKEAHRLYKNSISKSKAGAWKSLYVYGTYLHTMFRCNFQLIKEYFDV